MIRKIIFSIILNLVMVFLVVLGVSAQVSGPTAIPAPSDDEVNRVAKNLYCPVCENIPLDVCESKACVDWRAEIRLRLSQGWSDQQIYDYFVERHGDRVLASPPPRGFNWLAYVIPPLAILGGAIVLYTVLRSSLGKFLPESQNGDPDQDLASSSSVNDDYAVRLEDELKKRQ